MTHSAALELREHGIHVALLIVDATIDSPKTASMTAGRAPEETADQAEIARAVEYLATQSARALTHELVVTPGGRQVAAMTLSIGTGPLAGSPGGEFNFSLDDAPKHRIYYADFAPRLRAVLGGGALFDTTRAKLLYETGIMPVPYIPLEDFDAARMTRSDRSTHCPFKGDASYWSVGDVENVVWAYEDPKPEAAWLKGYAAVYWNRMEGWFIEEEPVFAHLRDPYHRVDVHESSRPVVVRAGGEVIARSERPKLLFETEPADARLRAAGRRRRGRSWSTPRSGRSARTRARRRTGRCPGSRTPPGATRPRCPEAVKIQGHVSFDAEGVEVELGEPRASVPSARPAAR